MRADARDNRARILTAAEEVLASPQRLDRRGREARRGGIATVFRHFPTKADCSRPS